MFSNDTTQFVSLGTQPTIYSVAISYIDCNHLSVLTSEDSRYTVAIYDVVTRSLVDTYHGSAMSINGLHQSATVDMISVLVSNSTGVYLDILNWNRNASACTAVEPLSPPVVTPTYSPITSPESIQPTISPTTNNTNVGDAPSISPVNAVAVGVGVSIPVAVAGVAIFLLVFFLRKRTKNNKKKTNAAQTQMNPVTDLDDPSTSQANTNAVNTTNSSEVHHNLPVSNANKVYTSMGLSTVDSNNDSFIAASVVDHLPDIDKRLHIPYKSLMFVKEIGAGSFGKVYSG